MSDPKPSVCRLVQVILDGWKAQTPIAAVITEVTPSGIGVHLMPPPHMEVEPRDRYLTYEPDVRNTAGAYWRWPPRE